MKPLTNKGALNAARRLLKDEGYVTIPSHKDVYDLALWARIRLTRKRKSK